VLNCGANSPCGRCGNGSHCATNNDCETNLTCSTSTYLCIPSPSNNPRKGSAIIIVVFVIIIIVIAVVIYCCCCKSKPKIDDNVPTGQPIEAIAVISNESLLQKHDFTVVTPGIVCRYCGSRGTHYSLFCPQKGQGQGRQIQRVEEKASEGPFHEETAGEGVTDEVEVQ